MSEVEIAIGCVAVIGVPLACMIIGTRARAERQRLYRDALRRGDMGEVHRLMGFENDD